MKVKDLIALLQFCNPEHEVYYTTGFNNHKVESVDDSNATAHDEDEKVCLLL